MRRIYISILLLVGLSSCSDFLDKKPDRSIVIPETVADVRAILDYQIRINENYSGLIEIIADDYFLDYQTLQTRSMVNQNLYLWDDGPDVFEPRGWSGSYGAIMTANVALESIDKIQGNSLQLDPILQHMRGEALFVRAVRLYQLAQLYCAPFEPHGSNDGLGLPIRNSSNFHIPTARSTVKEMYEAILQDLHLAGELLPENTEAFTRPSVAAAYAALAKVYLSMHDYDNALSAVEKALERKSELIDYNDLSLNDPQPFGLSNPEIIYYAHTTDAGAMITKNLANVDTALYNLFDENDLRKYLFFEKKGNGYYAFKGQYTNSEFNLFMGLATDELYLIRAECYVRKNQLGKALEDINTLLSKRWKAGYYRPLDIHDSIDILDLIITERRKQLMFRGVRWGDVRRLNFEGRYAQTLRRVLRYNDKEEIYELPPHDLRYIQLIPQTVIEQSGIEQNKR